MFDNLRERMENRREEKMTAKQGELFQAQMQYFLSCDRYGMGEHIKGLEDIAKLSGMDNWKKVFRSEAEQKEIEQRFQDLKIAQALTDDERVDPDEITRRAKLRIASELGLDVAAVNRFIRTYEQNVETHKWAHARHAAGEPLPADPAEYYNMMMENPASMSKKMRNKMMGKKRGRGQINSITR